MTIRIIGIVVVWAAIIAIMYVIGRAAGGKGKDGASGDAKAA